MRNDEALAGDGRRVVVASVLFAVVVALLYAAPVLVNLDYWGIQDWDQHVFHHALARDSILEYGQMPYGNLAILCPGIIQTEFPDDLGECG